MLCDVPAENRVEVCDVPFSYVTCNTLFTYHDYIQAYFVLVLWLTRDDDGNDGDDDDDETYRLTKTYCFS